MKWMVTGHKGFIGSHLAETLSDCTGVDLKNGRNAAYWKDPIEFDVICHLAGLSGIRDCEDNMAEAINNNIRSMCVFRNNTHRRGIIASSMAVMNPSSIYGLTKKSSEDLAEYLGVSVIRFANVFGPGSRNKTSVIASWCKEAIKSGTITVHGTGEQLRDFIYIDDIISAIHTVARHDGYLYEAGTGITRPLMQAAEIMSEISGARIQTVKSIITTNSEPADTVTLEEAGWHVDRSLDTFRTHLKRTYDWFIENSV